MPLKLSKLLVIGLAVIVAVSALLIVRSVTRGHDRYWLLAHDRGPNTAVDVVYWLLHSSWAILGILAIVVLAARGASLDAGGKER